MAVLKGGCRPAKRRLRARDKYPTQEERSKRLKEQREPARLRKREIKLVARILDKVGSGEFDFDGCEHTVLKNLHILINHPCAEKYAVAYQLGNALLKLTKHANPQVSAVSWKVLKMNVETWASTYKAIIDSDMPDIGNIAPTFYDPLGKAPVRRYRPQSPDTPSYEEPSSSESLEAVGTPVQDREAPLLMRRKESSPIVLGYIGTDSEIISLVKRAARQLKGGKFCGEATSAAQTHVVVSDKEPSLGMASAVADGAFLLHPEWIETCVEEGYWLEEDGYEVDCEASETSGCVRSKSISKPLDQVMLAVHKGGNGWSVGNMSGLEQVAKKLGAELVGMRCCAVCVVCDGAMKPMNLPPYAKVVDEEWLLNVALTYQLPSDFFA
ncbi:hypothetical protein BSKO_01799 [Bryopsis sp. KO-2023]|nr:hypothetical protein BSKO_01799 [Bryopsis sp. KO-2023]